MNFLKDVFPRGPSFRNARRVEKRLSGSKLSFMVPPAFDPFSSIQQWETEPDSFDIEDVQSYHPLEYQSGVSIKNKAQFNAIKVLNLFSTRWGFKGVPLLQSYGGHINFFINLNYIDDLPVNESLFNDEVLVREVYRRCYLTDLQKMHEGIKSDRFDLTQYKWPDYLSPLNCQWVNQKGKIWFYFESQPLADGVDKVSWNLAVSDKVFLCCRFIISRAGSNAGNAYRLNQRTPWDNYIGFIQRIMDSMMFEFSPGLSCRYEEVQSELSRYRKPIVQCTAQQLEEAKHVMQMWSDVEYLEPGKSRDESHRATREEVSSFLDKRIQPRRLHNSYPLGEKIDVASRISFDQIEKPFVASGKLG
ncbi:hypothetical protein [Microbulbifer sp. TRSA007]|uniref:hypothetical protein n=1 Tax=Microbulbifer sp. TRSA007 TaxID=3243384 RepID=UPI0040394A6F